MDNFRGIALLIAATLAGCNDGAAEPDDHRVCPSCKPAAGGESFDFGSTSECVGAAREITAEDMATFGVDAVLARIPSSLRRSLHWTVDEDRLADGLGGFEEHTSLAARISLGEPAFSKGVNLVDASRSCPDAVTVPATVSLSTGDGALVGVVLQGALRIDSSNPPQLYLRSDLADAYGSLDLQLAADHDGAGSLRAFLTVMPEGLIGDITVNVEGGEQPIAAKFPDPACASERASDGLASCAADEDSRAVDLSEVNQHPPRPPEVVDEPGEYEVTTEIPLFDELFIRAERDCDPGEEPEALPPSGLGCMRFYFNTGVLRQWCVVPDADSFDDYESSRTDDEGRVILDSEGNPIPDVPRGVTPVPGSEHCEADGIETGPDRDAGYYPSKFCRVAGCEVAR